MSEVNYSNRRFIRKQAMCALYTLHVLRRVHQSFAKDEIKKSFEFNSLKNSLDEKKELEQQCDEALRAIDDFFSKNLKQEIFHHRDPRVLAAINNSYYSYQSALQLDLLVQSAALDRLEIEINQITLSILQLLIEWGRLLGDTKFLSLVDKNIDSQNILKKIAHNPLLNRLTTSEKFNQALKKYNVDWSKEKIHVEDALLNALPFIEKNLDVGDAGFLIKVVKKSIFSEDGALGLFMKKSLAWSQINFLILNILKKIFNALEDSHAVTLLFGEQEALFRISQEGKDFFKRLVGRTVDNETEIEGLLKKNLENWDVTRVIPLDKIIAQLGICEIIFFPEIPNVISINEYIEIAKEYGSDQSGKFINGILNAVACEKF